MNIPTRKIMIGMVLAAAGLAAPSLLCLPSAGLRADDSSTEVHLTGTLDSVDVGGSHAVIVTESGLRYTLDTGHADITTHGDAGRTGELTPEMHVQVAGEPLSDGTIRVDRIAVEDNGASPAPDTPVAPAPAAGPETIHLHGSVISVDERAGSFIVHINDHTRTIFVDDSTDFSDDGQSPSGDDDSLPVQAGDRVTVGGVMRPDGTVVADTVQDDGATPADAALIGRVVTPSSRYSTRDIKIRVSTDRDVTVHVPNDAPVLRDGHRISVHDLTGADVVRVDGIPDGGALQATRVVVVPADTVAF
jgi:hypothetical protein